MTGISRDRSTSRPHQPNGHIDGCLLGKLRFWLLRWNVVHRTSAGDTVRPSRKIIVTKYKANGETIHWVGKTPFPDPPPPGLGVGFALPYGTGAAGAGSQGPPPIN